MVVIVTVMVTVCRWARSAMVLVTRYLGHYWPGKFTALEMLRVLQVNLYWPMIGLEALASVVVATGGLMILLLDWVRACRVQVHGVGDPSSAPTASHVH